MTPIHIIIIPEELTMQHSLTEMSDSEPDSPLVEVVQSIA